MPNKLIIKLPDEKHFNFIQKQVLFKNGIHPDGNIDLLHFHIYGIESCLAINPNSYLTFCSDKWYREHGYVEFFSFSEFINTFCKWKSGEWVVLMEKIEKYFL